MKKRNTLALILAMLLVCGSASVYAFGGKGPGKAPGAEKQTADRIERTQKAPELTEEQKAEITEKVKAELAEKLESGTITQEEYDEYIAKLEAGEIPQGIRGRGDSFGGMERPKAPALTEEQKAEILEKAKTELAEKLANGEITQEQYDETLAKLDSGEFPIGIRGRGNGFGGMEKPEASELTEEQKSEMITKMQEKISTLLAKGEITQEQYDDYLAKINSGELPLKGMGGKGHAPADTNKGRERR